MLILNGIRALRVRCWQSVKNLSLFYQQSTDPYKIESGRIATWIYIVLLVTLLVVLNVFYGWTDVSQTISIKTPSVDTYRSLVDQYPSLACPCQRTDLSYGQFIALTPVYHQVEF